jgi:hypothetical protein
MSPISEATVKALIQPNPGRGHEQRDVAVIGALTPELAGQPRDLQLEIVDQLQAGVDVAPPRVREREPIEQLTAGVAEQVRDRARVPERDQRRVDAVLQRRAMPHQMQPEARQLALAPDARVGQPDRRHQIALRQQRKHARVDLVGLAGQRRQPLDLLRVGDQHLPAELLERVMHEPRAVHRLDHRPHPLTREPPRQAAQAVGVRRRSRLRDQFAVLGQQTDVEPTSTQIQTSVQHENGPPRARSSMTRRACHRGGPPSSQSNSAASGHWRGRM